MPQFITDDPPNSHEVQSLNLTKSLLSELRTQVRQDLREELGALVEALRPNLGKQDCSGNAGSRIAGALRNGSMWPEFERPGTAQSHTVEPQNALTPDPIRPGTAPSRQILNPLLSKHLDREHGNDISNEHYAAKIDDWARHLAGTGITARPTSAPGKPPPLPPIPDALPPVPDGGALRQSAHQDKTTEKQTGPKGKTLTLPPSTLFVPSHVHHSPRSNQEMIETEEDDAAMPSSNRNSTGSINMFSSGPIDCVDEYLREHSCHTNYYQHKPKPLPLPRSTTNITEPGRGSDITYNEDMGMRVAFFTDEPINLGEKTSWGLNGRLRKAVENPCFEYTIGVFLFLNAVSIGVHAELRAAQPDADPPSIFHTLELIFGTIFTLEVAVRLYVFRRAFFTMKGCAWNVFDFFVVFLQDAEILLELILDSDNAMKDLTFLRLLRLGRIVRLLRMVRIIPEMKSMVCLIAASMQSFLWTMVLLILLMFGVAVHLTEVVADHRKENPTSDMTQLDDAWGSLFRSTLSLYQAILGGIDWKDLMDELQNITWSVNVVFMMYVAFAALVMLNLVTGVFVEGAQRIVAQDQDSDLIRNAKKIFCMIDDSEDSEISWSEFVSHLDDPGMSEYFKVLGISRNDAKDLFQLLDVDRSGLLTLKEFVNGCLQLRGHAKSLDLARMAHNAEAQGKRLKGIEKLLKAVARSHHIGIGAGGAEHRNSGGMVGLLSQASMISHTIPNRVGDCDISEDLWNNS